MADDELKRATMHSADTLRQRGIRLTGNELPEELADLQTAVERFEASARARGADSFTDTPMSSNPEHPGLVIPERSKGEEVADYIARIERASE